MKSTINFILVVIAYFAATTYIKYPNFNFDDYKDVFLLGILILIIINFGIHVYLSFKRTTMLRTKYDILIQVINLTIGIACGYFAIKFWSEQDTSRWLLLIFSFLGLAHGIFYQNSIQFSKGKKGLIIQYKHRSKKFLNNPDTITYSKKSITISEKERVIEIFDFEDTDINLNKIKTFFNANYPDIQMIINN